MREVQVATTSVTAVADGLSGSWCPVHSRVALLMYSTLRRDGGGRGMSLSILGCCERNLDEAESLIAGIVG